MTIAPGWYEGMPMSDYLAIPALSASGLEVFRRSPAHYRYEQEHPKAPTDAMKLGTALHMALLEPHLFTEQYIALRPCEAVLKSGARKGDECGHPSRVYRDGVCYCGKHDPAPEDPISDTWMAADALDQIEGMKRAVLEHPDARRFFAGKGRSEVVGVWKDPATGVLCKMRLDRDIDRASIHADLKATADASEAAFQRQVGRMGYARKAAWYRRGMRELGKPAMASVLIAVEFTAPYGCQTFLLDEDQLGILSQEIDGHLRRYAECLRSDTWPAYDAGLRHLELLPWDMPGKKAPPDQWGDAA